MLQQASWFGVSLALHLTVATTLVVVASRNVERTPETIMVVLDNLAPMETPRDKDRHTPAISTERSPVPAKVQEPQHQALAPKMPLSAAPQVPPAPPAHEPGLAGEPPKASPETQPAAARRTRSEETVLTAPSVAKLAGQLPAHAAEERPSAEKAQQRYLKEHFAYIRNLITQQMVYPPMARKMRWSGRTVVSFVIAEDGNVHNVRVVETSGHPVLDKSASETVRNAAPFPRPPVRAEIVVPINFQLL